MQLSNNSFQPNLFFGARTQGSKHLKNGQQDLVTLSTYLDMLNNERKQQVTQADVGNELGIQNTTVHNHLKRYPLGEGLIAVAKKIHAYYPSIGLGRIDALLHQDAGWSSEFISVE